MLECCQIQNKNIDMWVVGIRIKNKNIDLGGVGIRIKNKNIDLGGVGIRIKDKNDDLRCVEIRIKNKNIDLGGVGIRIKALFSNFWRMLATLYYLIISYLNMILYNHFIFSNAEVIQKRSSFCYKPLNWKHIPIELLIYISLNMILF